MTNKRTIGPKILLVGMFGKFLGTARLPASLRNAGAEVHVLCEQGSFLGATRHVDDLITVSGRKGFLWKYQYRAALFSALAKCPDLIIPMDEISLHWLHSFRVRYAGFLKLFAPKIGEVLNRSLPPPARYPAATSRFNNQQLAEKLGVRCPVAESLKSAAELEKFIARTGLPVVLKAEHTTAGIGVRVCHSIEEAQTEWTSLVKGEDNPSVLVQRYIDGTPAMYSFTVLNGQILNGISALKLTCHPAPNGPSATIMIVDNPEMLGTAHAMAKALCLTGYASFDFVVEHNTEHAYLIECNPRPTPICHLGSLSASLLEALGSPPKAALAPLPSGIKIALYPQEWIRRNSEVKDLDVIPDLLQDDPELLALYENVWRPLVAPVPTTASPARTRQ